MASYSLSWSVPWSVVAIASDFPSEETDFPFPSRCQLHIVSWLECDFVSTCPFQAWGLAVLNLCRHRLRAHISTGHVVSRRDCFLGCHPSSLALTTLSASPSTEIPKPWGAGLDDDIPIRTQYFEVSFCTSSSLSANAKQTPWVVLVGGRVVSFCFVLTLFLSCWGFFVCFDLNFWDRERKQEVGRWRGSKKG